MNQNSVINTLKQKFPDLKFRSGDVFVWSPKDETVYYESSDNPRPHYEWSLLHETGHALLNHKNYESDIELILMEADAWERAKEIGAELEIVIDEEHIQDCLDSYRDWLHKRSLCPHCKLGGIQINNHTYSCIFCNNEWMVSPARFCRPYRRKIEG